MRGTAVLFICLISLHYLSIIDANPARPTSDDGSSESKEKSENREAEQSSTGLDSEEEIEADSSSTEDTKNSPRSADQFSGELKQILNNVIGSLNQILENKNVTRSAEGEADFSHLAKYIETKNLELVRKTVPILEAYRSKLRSEDELSQSAQSQREIVTKYLYYMKDVADMALGTVSNIIEEMGPPTLGPKQSDLRDKILMKLKLVEDELGELISKAMNEINGNSSQIPAKRQARSTGKRMSAADLARHYVNNFTPEELMNMRKLFRGLIQTKDAVTMKSDTDNELNLFRKIADAVRGLALENTRNSETQSPLLPLLNKMALMVKSAVNDNAEDNFRSDKIKHCDNGLRESDSPITNIFVIPVFDKPTSNATAARLPVTTERTTVKTTTTSRTLAVTSDKHSPASHDHPGTTEEPDHSEGSQRDAGSLGKRHDEEC